jgi:hypothetical protein
VGSSPRERKELMAPFGCTPSREPHALTRHPTILWQEFFEGPHPKNLNLQERSAP